MSGAFNGFRKQALMCRADPTDSPGQYFTPLGDKMTEKLPVLEIDIGDFFRAKFTHSLSADTESSLTWHSSLPFYCNGSGSSSLIPDEDSFTRLMEEPVLIRQQGVLPEPVSAFS